MILIKSPDIILILIKSPGVASIIGTSGTWEVDKASIVVQARLAGPPATHERRERQGGLGRRYDVQGVSDLVAAVRPVDDQAVGVAGGHWALGGHCDLVLRQGFGERWRPCRLGTHVLLLLLVGTHPVR